MLRTDVLEFDLPERLIATRPASPRDSARLMVVSRSDPSLIEHRTVRDLPDFLPAGDALVFNRTSVAPARLVGRRAETGGKVDGLFIADRTEAGGPARWAALLSAGSRLTEGARIELLSPSGEATGVALLVLGRESEGFLVGVDAATPLSTRDALARVGATPLPPYILKARKDAGQDVSDDLDRAWYQTVYADRSAAGSVAAPTAGLHFTPELLERIDAAGVRRLWVTLHVGMGTFQPVKTTHVEEHPMHAEWFEAPRETLAALCGAARPKRVIAVGTTSARTLESLPAEPDASGDARGETRLLITPGWRWRHVDGLMTNFHLPRSTLLAMVGALFPEGTERLLALYREAVRRDYRFYSYGDAMLVLP